MAETGSIHNSQKFKKLEEVDGYSIWEFKSFQLRFLGGFAPGRIFLVAHGLKKKRDAHKRRNLQKAARILREHHQHWLKPQVRNNG